MKIEKVNGGWLMTTVEGSSTKRPQGFGDIETLFVSKKPKLKSSTTVVEDGYKSQGSFAVTTQIYSVGHGKKAVLKKYSFVNDPGYSWEEYYEVLTQE